MDYEKLNTRATHKLKTLISGTKGVEFIDERKDGFYLETRYGRFWFQCEVDSIKGE